MRLYGNWYTHFTTNGWRHGRRRSYERRQWRWAPKNGAHWFAGGDCSGPVNARGVCVCWFGRGRRHCGGGQRRGGKFRYRSRCLRNIISNIRLHSRSSFLLRLPMLRELMAKSPCSRNESQTSYEFRLNLVGTRRDRSWRRSRHGKLGFVWQMQLIDQRIGQHLH